MPWESACHDLRNMPGCLCCWLGSLLALSTRLPWQAALESQQQVGEGPAQGHVRLGVGAGDRHVLGDVYLVNSRESLDALIAGGAAPERCRVYAGYSGWSAEQLQRETISGAWSVLDGDARIIFDRNPDTLWDRLIKRAGGLEARRSTGDSPS